MQTEEELNARQKAALARVEAEERVIGGYQWQHARKPDKCAAAAMAGASNALTRIAGLENLGDDLQTSESLAVCIAGIN